MLHIDLEKAKALVNESIEARGADFVYEKEGNSCLYVHNVEQAWDPETEEYTRTFDNATPGCLVGDALKRGGIPIEAMGGAYNDAASGELLSKLEIKEFLTYTDGAAAFFSNAQESQDNGAPWGRAVSEAAKGNALRKTYEVNPATGLTEWTGDFRSVDGLTVE